METSSRDRVVLVTATVLFLLWTSTYTIFWPVEDYANLTLAYAESTNAVVRGMAVGTAVYLSVIGVVLGWRLTGR